jgi:hypothetical protein
MSLVKRNIFENRRLAQGEKELRTDDDVIVCCPDRERFIVTPHEYDVISCKQYCLSDITIRAHIMKVLRQALATDNCFVNTLCLSAVAWFQHLYYVMIYFLNKFWLHTLMNITFGVKSLFLTLVY